MPITWKSVSGSSGAGNAAVGAKLFEQSREAIRDGFSGLQGILRQKQATDLANWDQIKENNTQAFLDKLAQYKTPEALQAAQASGELDPLRQGFGAQIDQAAVRDADNKMLDTLRQRATAGYNYEKQRTAQLDDPVLQRLGAELLAVNPENLKGINGAFGGLEAQANQLFTDGKLSAAGRLAFLKDLDGRRENRETDLQGDITFGNQQASHGVTMRNAANAQSEFDYKIGQRDQQERLNAFIQQGIDSGQTEQEIRQGMVKYARENDLNPALTFQAVGQLPTMYGATHNLTAEQTASLGAQTAPLQTGLESTVASLDHEFKTLKERRPVNPVFAFGDEKRVTEGDALSKFTKDFDISDGDRQETQKYWEAFRKANKLDAAKDYGPVLQEALSRVRSNGGNWANSKNDVAFGDLEEVFGQVLREYNNSETNFADLDTAYKNTEQKKLEAKQTFTAESSKLLQRFKDENNFRNFVKKGS